MNKITALLKQATDILLVKNPEGTALGIGIGIILQGLLLVFKGTLQNLYPALDWNSITVVHLAAIGIVLMNVRTVARKDKPPQQVTEALDFIEKQLAFGRISEAQAKLQYQALIRKVVENVTISPADSKQPVSRRQPKAVDKPKG